MVGEMHPPISMSRQAHLHILAACIFFDAPKCFKMLLSYEGVNFNSNISNIELFASSKILELAIVDAMITHYTLSSRRIELKQNGFSF